MAKRMTGSTFIKFAVPLVLAWSSVLLRADMEATFDTTAVARVPWGGEHFILRVSKKGAEAEFDCARGQVTHLITLDKHGDFDVRGTFTPAHGGPVRQDENAPPTPAHYSGHVDGDTMSLTVTLAREKVGTFMLPRGSRPNLRKCR
jgi:hypothetical protein